MNADRLDVNHDRIPSIYYSDQHFSRNEAQMQKKKECNYAYCFIDANREIEVMDVCCEQRYKTRAGF